jgi:predicted nuclease with TOPRIM domain
LLSGEVSVEAVSEPERVVLRRAGLEERVEALAAEVEKLKTQFEEFRKQFE